MILVVWILQMRVRKFQEKQLVLVKVQNCLSIVYKFFPYDNQNYYYMLGNFIYNKLYYYYYRLCNFKIIIIFFISYVQIVFIIFRFDNTI